MITLKQKGRPIAQIEGGKYNKDILSIYDKEQEKSCCGMCNSECSKKKKAERCCDNCKPSCHKEEKETIGHSDLMTKFDVNDGKLEMIPNIKTREIVYIAGPSGSGKSTLAAKYIQKYKEIFPKSDFFLFSRLKEDPVLDKLKPNRIMIDETLVTKPINIEKEIKKGAIILFDDCETIQNDYIKHAIQKVMNDIMETGRKLCIWLVITNHLVIPNERKFARTVLNEIHSFSFFPKSGSAQQITYCLQRYFGLSKKQIENILQIPSRWITINKNYPQYCLHEHGVFIL